MSINYESELNDILIEKLQQFYGVFREDIAYKIFLIRFYLDNISEYKKKKNSWELERKLPLFLIDELNLPIIDGKLKYKEETVFIYRSAENSILNIMDDWFFRYADTFTHNIKGENTLKRLLVDEEIAKIAKEADKLIKIKKKDAGYHNYFMKSSLEILNRMYGILPTDIGRIQGFYYPANHNDFKMTLEEKYERLTHLDRLEKGTLNTLSEEVLERYLIHNLNFIEEGLSLIGNQYIINNGRLDIFARDKDGNYCIIELKVEDDERLIWQSMYYPMAVKEKFNTDKIRMIVVAPEISEHILKPLRQLDNIEVFKFKVKMKYNQITDLKINRIA